MARIESTASRKIPQEYRLHFKKMFEDAARRQFDLVLFWSLDRFSREGVLETLQAAPEELQAEG